MAKKKAVVPDLAITLMQRGRTYGDFVKQAQITRALKNVMYLQPNWMELDDDMREALEMIQVKVARILNGDAKYFDNWHDIEGYARLVGQRLKP